MGVIDFGTGSYLVKFDDQYSDGLFAVQGDTARQFHFIITDLNNQAINTSNLQLKMNLFVKNRKAGVATSVRQSDGSFLMTIPQGLILEHDENAKYQLFITDGVEILSQKSGVFRIEQNILFDNGGGVNLLFDFLEFQKALEQQEVYLTQMSDNLDLTINTKNQVTILEASALISKNQCQSIEAGLSGTLQKETERQSNESARISNENIRESNESSRVTVETNRVSAEHARVGAESTRETNENARVSAENARVGAESTRETNENARVSAENARVSAEDSRVIAESGRVSTENTRISNENSRGTQWTNLKAELQTLMGQLEDIDVGNLQVQINSTNATVANKVDKINGKGLSTNDYDNTSKDKVDNIPASPKYTDTITTVANNLTTTSTTSALSANQGKILNDNKVDKVTGKGLSTNDYDNTSKGKVDAIPASPKYTDTITTVVNNLTTTSTTSALSANQGKILNDNKMDKSGGTFTGQVKAQSNTDYSVGQVRNIASGTTLPSTSGFGNGDIFIVRSS